MRAVRTDRWKYIRNLHPERTYETHISRGIARDGRDYWESWLTAALDDESARRIVAAYEQRPAEEFYDLSRDPHERKNLAHSLPHELKNDLRTRLATWRAQQGEVP